MIRGDVRTADGRQRGFPEPCLTTWEARGMSAWLRDVAAGDVVTGRWAIAFTEPDLAFSLAGHRAGRIRLRACLSHEALPPWVPRDRDGWQAGEYVFILDVSQEDLGQAASTWDLGSEPFPER